MKRSLMIGAGVLAALVVAGLLCVWQRPRLARLGMGLSGELGPVSGDANAQVVIDYPSVWGDARCRPNMDAPMRIHRTYPGTLGESGLLGDLA